MSFGDSDSDQSVDHKESEDDRSTHSDHENLLVDKNEAGKDPVNEKESKISKHSKNDKKKKSKADN